MMMATMLRAAVKAARTNVQTIERIVVEAAIDALREQDKGSAWGTLELVVGYWPCPGWEGGICVYHEYDDPAHDHCLFCREPHERK